MSTDSESEAEDISTHVGSIQMLAEDKEEWHFFLATLRAYMAYRHNNINFFME